MWTGWPVDPGQSVTPTPLKHHPLSVWDVPATPVSARSGCVVFCSLARTDHCPPGKDRPLQGAD